ncbi:hypothetical protein C8R44DRAFT_744463 [Mycena epipterygia]|nr:hypothetical protein C8R44DRAFT_744463 [Mycena epipterygia]
MPKISSRSRGLFFRHRAHINFNSHLCREERPKPKSDSTVPPVPRGATEGPHVHQMNNGHRQDTMINHHNDWNHKKTMNLGVSLAEDISEAKIKKYVEKRNHFIALSISFHGRAQQWQQRPRTSSKTGKEAVSVYKHNITKGKNKVAHFMDEGLKIQDMQYKLKQLIHDSKAHELVSTQKEIQKRTVKTQVRIEAWRKTQILLMLRIGNKAAAQSVNELSVHDEKLFLPSTFLPRLTGGP